MSEQPTYWKHSRTGEVCKNTGGGVYRNLRNNECMLWAKEECDKFTQIPTPQVGEKWSDGDHYIVICQEFLNSCAKGNKTLDLLMLNYRRVEDAPKKEHSYTIKPVANGAGYYLCSCGWRSKVEDDGDIFKPDRYSAKDDWDRHVAEATTTLLPEHLENDTSKLTDMAIRRIEQIQKSAVAYVQNINSVNALNSLITLCTMSQELRRRVIEVSRGDFDTSALEIKPDCVHDWRQIMPNTFSKRRLAGGWASEYFFCTKCLDIKAIEDK